MFIDVALVDVVQVPIVEIVCVAAIRAVDVLVLTMFDACCGHSFVPPKVTGMPPSSSRFACVLKLGHRPYASEEG